MVDHNLGSMASRNDQAAEDYFKQAADRLDSMRDKVAAAPGWVRYEEAGDGEERGIERDFVGFIQIGLISAADNFSYRSVTVVAGFSLANATQYQCSSALHACS